MLSTGALEGRPILKHKKELLLEDIYVVILDSYPGQPSTCLIRSQQKKLFVKHQED
jgi:hypothetical protein